MNLERLHDLVEDLRREAIGSPAMIEPKHAYEYPEQSAKVVAVLKLVRATHGVNALETLCQLGLFIDFGAIVRCVNDCNEDVYFLMEEYPKESGNVVKYVKNFFEHTIDGYLAVETNDVPRDKIRNALVRVLKGGQDENTRKMLEKIYVAHCGYVHANYAHVMEVYNGHTDLFNLRGVPSTDEIEKRWPYVEMSAQSVLHAAAFLANKLQLNGLHCNIVKALE